MTDIQEIEVAVRQLSRDELGAFRNWLQEFNAEAWDRQFEEGVAAGRLDHLADESIRDLREGQCTEL